MRQQSVGHFVQKREQLGVFHSVKKRQSGASLRRETTNTKWCAGPARLRTPYRLNYHVCGNASDRSPAIEQRLGSHECAWSHCAKPTV
jgi:hypothetical protein